MKTLIITFIFLTSFNLFAMSEKDTNYLISLNEESFSHKEIQNNHGLCSFHNSLLQEVGRKPIHCARKEAPETRDSELITQINNIPSFVEYNPIDKETEKLLDQQINKFKNK